MSDQQHDDHGVEDLDVPESDAEHVVGGIGIGKKLGPEASIKIDRVGLKDNLNNY